MANPVIPTPDTQDPHPPAEAEGWTQKYKNNTVSVLELYNQLKQSNALRDTYRLKLDVTRKVVLLVCLLCGANLACCNLSHAQSQHDKHCKQRPAAEQPPPLPNPTAQSVPPFDSLSEQQQADLAPTVSRLAGASLGAALRELNAFENADWNPAMKRRAQSMLQMQTLQQPTQPGQPSFTPIASIEARRAFWKLQAAPQFPILAKAAQRLLSAHASTAAAERNWSVWGHTYHNALRNNR
ncbi:hypothetical protein QJQ45_002657 [Haematococcus lacustris]|nr:hypothetical protein QJQ45_002657 [Haematococcus lacustris]